MTEYSEYTEEDEWYEGGEIQGDLDREEGND